MSSSFGSIFRVNIFGQSHSAGIGVVIEGIPAGFAPDIEALKAFMRRRSPGNGCLSSARREDDEYEIISGLSGEITCGSPLCCLIRNKDCISHDYDAIADTPRPGHADYTTHVKYAGFNDKKGGGHSAGRLTAPLCFAGGLAVQLLEKKGVRLAAHVLRIGDVYDRRFDTVYPEIDEISDGDIRLLDKARFKDMSQAILSAKEAGDSVSGDIELAVVGLEAGVGEPMFDGLENVLSKAIFAIPGVKSISFGQVQNLGSENNDAFDVVNGAVVTKTNHCGGILGGISNGMPILLSVTVKPTPSISKPQQTVDLRDMSPATITVSGRHDPCIVPRATVTVEAAAAIALYDMCLRKKAEIWN